ncbi:L-asparagine oxygenase [Actinoplanes sp. OR16]|uniref:guanitoxin biosynthesis L-enduracididine beta-hydroxylase GntD n=1 Tax=Actinoplanes sp. OR16 TaxID=946334 RepID=UPI000F70F414|nr:guanitoxin biosynthesis L-enduracididine beta-hydroxylase GntD [Actinoplanes sp. OR16]BBH67845.1 L-asparagine oxygenase [Actinoplanes sp. OR16]
MIETMTRPASSVDRLILRYRLTTEEAAQAEELARSCLQAYGSVDSPRFLADAGVLAADLPFALRDLANVARLDDRKHAVVISGSHIDDALLGDTPACWQEADTAESRLYGMQLALYATLFGDVVGWATQQAGRLVADVVPTRGHEQVILNSCSTRELAWHTEDAFSPYRADYVGLLCLRSPDLAATTLSSVDLRRIPDEVAAILAEPRFVILPDNAHDPDHNAGAQATDDEAFDRLAGVRQQPPPVALLDGHPGAPVLRIDRDFVAAVDGDPAAERALAWLVGHLDRNLYDVPLAAGDACFIDNRNAVHGRRPFQARYDGRDRWLKRVNVVTDLRRSRPARQSATDRVIG